MAAVKAKKPTTKLKAGQKKKVNKWLILGGVAAVAIIGAVVVRFSGAATVGTKTIIDNSGGVVKVCRRYNSKQQYVLTASVARRTSAVTASAMWAASAKSSDGRGLSNIRFMSDKKTSWAGGSLQTYTLTAPTRYMAAYLYKKDGTNWYSTPQLISSLPTCK